MSLQQIWGRFRQLARSQRIREIFQRDDPEGLRRAETLIKEAEERDREEELRKFRQATGEGERTRGRGKVDGKRAVYEAACRVLGVPPDASFERIFGAYRAGLMLYHPDRNAWKGEEGVRKATRRTQELNEAFGAIRRFHNGQA